MECGGLPPFSSNPNVRQQCAPGETCLARRTLGTPISRLAFFCFGLCSCSGHPCFCLRFSPRPLRSYLCVLCVKSFLFVPLLSVCFYLCLSAFICGAFDVPLRTISTHAILPKLTSLD